MFAVAAPIMFREFGALRQRLAGWEARSTCQAELLPLVDEDLPAFDALQFENAMLDPWIIF